VVPSVTLLPVPVAVTEAPVPKVKKSFDPVTSSPVPLRVTATEVPRPMALV
jgi:hypothetical protein